MNTDKQVDGAYLEQQSIGVSLEQEETDLRIKRQKSGVIDMRDDVSENVKAALKASPSIKANTEKSFWSRFFENLGHLNLPAQ